jgi:hypothetical protein
MTINEKVSNALKSASTYLKESMSALAKGDEVTLDFNLWHVAAELEYVLFLFSMTLPEDSGPTELKPNSKLKTVETRLTLNEVGNLLNRAERFIASERLLDAYKNVHVARNRVLRVQEHLSGKRRRVSTKR